MDALQNTVFGLSRDLERKKEILFNLDKARKSFEELNNHYEDSIEAQQLLGTLADGRANYILEYVTSIINKALVEVFPRESKQISLERKLHGNKHPHINVVLRTEDGRTRDLVTQSGTGLRQIISFLYRLCLIEITGARKLVIMDELLGGVHKEAASVIEDMMDIFSKGGFQFVVVDYALSEKMGRTYLVERQNNGDAGVREVADFEDLGQYNVRTGETREDVGSPAKETASAGAE